jgi:hypothetical protein
MTVTFWEIMGVLLVFSGLVVGSKGLARNLQHSSDLRSHAYKARAFSAAALLVFIGLGILTQNWAAIIPLALVLAGVWIEYLIARAQFRDLTHKDSQHKSGRD